VKLDAVPNAETEDGVDGVDAHCVQQQLDLPVVLWLDGEALLVTVDGACPVQHDTFHRVQQGGGLQPFPAAHHARRHEPARLTILEVEIAPVAALQGDGRDARRIDLLARQIFERHAHAVTRREARLKVHVAVGVDLALRLKDRIRPARKGHARVVVHLDVVHVDRFQVVRAGLVNLDHAEAIRAGDERLALQREGHVRDARHGLHGELDRAHDQRLRRTRAVIRFRARENDLDVVLADRQLAADANAGVPQLIGANPPDLLAVHVQNQHFVRNRPVFLVDQMRLDSGPLAHRNRPCLGVEGEDRHQIGLVLGPRRQGQDEETGEHQQRQERPVADHSSSSLTPAERWARRDPTTMVRANSPPLAMIIAPYRM